MKTSFNMILQVGGRMFRNSRFRILLFVLTFGFGLALAFTLATASRVNAQAVTGTITGLVTDPSGAAIAGAAVTATNTQTGVAVPGKTDGAGKYAFPLLPIGTYDISIVYTGFKQFVSTRIVLNAGQVYTVNAQLEIGALGATVTVEMGALQVQTQDTQLATVVTGSAIENMPLINRNVLGLMETEPGVMASNDRFGTNSVNGSQTQQNGYQVNGTDFNDVALNTPLIGHLPPNPDAIAEFSLITNTINPEYGRNSGAIVNQVIKSGTNSFHGSAADFYRDTFLNAKDFFAKSPQIFHRHIFDGTLGGPIIKRHLFGFFSYEGLRQRAAASPVLVTVFTTAQLAGNFGAGFVSPPATGTGAAPIPEYGDSKSPCPVGGSSGMCPAGTAYSTLWSTGVIPTQDFNALALKYVNAFNPAVNFGTNQYSAQFPNLDTVNQYMWRVDEVVNSKDTLWGYGYIERESSGSALPFTGANVPGFASVAAESISNYTVAWDHTFSTSALNDLRIGYTRFNFVAVEPAKSTLPSSIGFAINPQFSSAAGLPFIGLPSGDINLGFSTNGPQPRIDQNYQIDDNLGYTIGRHQLKFGIDARRFWTNSVFGARNNGSYTFSGAGTYSTGDPFADLLLGFPDSYAQSSGGPWDARAQEFYIYAQDSWTVRRDLTINYGLGWQINTPWILPYNHFTALNCFRPGEQSFVYPSSPVGIVFPGDVGCSSSGEYTHFNNVGPRLGLAWSPDLGRLSGGAGNLSIRAGAGIYYNQTEDEGALQNLTAPPLQISDAGFADALGTAAFQNPFAAIQCLNQQNQPIAGCTAINPATKGGLLVTSIPNKYPFSAPPKGFANIDFSNYGPLSLNLLDPNYRTPYSVNYNLTVQRKFSGSMLLTVGYVGAEGRHEERFSELNPLLDPVTCANTPSCAGAAPFQYGAPGSVYKYGPQPVPSFVTPAPGASEIVELASLAQQQTDGNSHYNALQASLQKSFSHGLDFLVAYTWSHSIDDASNLEDLGFNGLGTNTFLPKLNYGDSAFDARHRFVASYDYTLPMRSSWTRSGFGSRALNGWRVSGITTAQTGFPVLLTNPLFTSLTCNAFEFYSCPDNLQATGAPLNISNPRSSLKHFYFNSAAFTTPALGTFGNVARYSFHGPGIWDTDLAVYKDTKISERMTLQLRLDAQNALNHAQFSNPIGNIASSAFGRITSTTEGPRIVQLGARFTF
jgi:hypothetical protein